MPAVIRGTLEEWVRNRMSDGRTLAHWMRDPVTKAVTFTSDLDEQIAWMKSVRTEEDNAGGRRVAWTDVEWHGQIIGVSTVFLMVDHSWGDGPPVLFETMLASGGHMVAFNGWQARYRTEDEAVVGHEAVVANLRAGLGPDGEAYAAAQDA